MAKRISVKDRREKDKKRSSDIFEPTEKAQSTSADTVKTTVYLRPDQILAIERIQLAERERTGQKPDKYALAQEAFDLLIEKHKTF